jgi:hypothetical protein
MLKPKSIDLKTLSDRRRVAIWLNGLADFVERQSADADKGARR